MAGATSARSYGRVFDEVAAEYDRNRPAYPDELVDRACEVAGIAVADPVLEVGCGSGQLTRSLVARGLRVAAVEPGRNLIALAQRNLEDLGRVEFMQERFEDVPLPERHYRAVFSASAFHWIDPALSWQKAAQALVPGGTLALLQYCSLAEPDGAPGVTAFIAALTRVAPEAAADWPPARDLATIVAGVERHPDNISEAWAWIGNHDVARAGAGHLFGDVQIATQLIVMEQTGAELSALLPTMSFYHRLSAEQRQALHDESVAVAEQNGGSIRASAVAVLVTARRNPFE